MPFSSIRFLGILRVALPLVVACSSSSTPSSASVGDSGAADTGAIAPTWTFGGGSISAAFTSSVAPALVTIPAGGDVEATIGLQFGAPSASGSLTFSSATNQGDVSPASLPTDDAAAVPATGAPSDPSNNPVLYLSIDNAGTTDISFAESPSLTLNATGDFATVLSGDVTCQLDLYVNGTWKGTGIFVGNGETGLPASFTIPAANLANDAALTFAPGQSLAAIGCD